LVGGGAAVCAGGFDARRFFDLLDVVRPTWFQGVPTTLRELLVHVRLAGRLPVASTLRLLRSVAAPLPSSTAATVANSCSSGSNCAL
jgi:acyl-CoA synthetase (AMP-forming)/AMP-acid ligase II